MGIFSGSDDEQPDWSQVIALDNEIKRLNQRIKELESKNGINWFSVEERLPNNGKDILILDVYGNFNVGNYDLFRALGGKEHWEFYTGIRDVIECVTHWAEINEPEKKDDI